MSLFCASGKLQLLKVSDGHFITKSYFLLENGKSSISRQSLAGPLAGFSLRCGSCPPDAVTRLSFQTESLRTLVFLADRVLSVVRIDFESTGVTQV